MPHTCRLCVLIGFVEVLLLSQIAPTRPLCQADDEPIKQRLTATNDRPVITQIESSKLDVDLDRIAERALAVLKQRVNDGQDDDNHFNAMLVLRRVQPTSAIPLLAKYLTFESPYFQPASGAGRTYDYYLAGQVLIGIGSPVVPEMLKLIGDPNRTELERRIACWVLLSIEARASDLGMEIAFEDDFVKEGVVRRLEHLNSTGLSNDRAVQFSENINFALDFIRSYANTDGRWQDNPEILGPHLLPLATAGVSIRHQFQGNPPKNFPKATLQFTLDENQDEDLGVRLSASGELTGTPKKPGILKLAINVRAKIDGTPSESRGRRIFKLYVRDPDEPRAK